jgi:peroxiredoxin
MKQLLQKTVIPVGVFSVVIFVSILSGCVDSSEKNQTMNVVFSTLDGSQKSLSDYYGKVIVLDLMGVNCQPCMAQMFELKKIQENYSSTKVTLISIDVWIQQGETSTLIQSYINAFKQQVNIDLNWTFGMDNNQGTIENAYAKSGVPTLYIIDQKGNIYYSNVGYEPYSTLKIKLDEVLKNNE